MKRKITIDINPATYKYCGNCEGITFEPGTAQATCCYFHDDQGWNVELKEEHGKRTIRQLRCSTCRETAFNPQTKRKDQA